MSTQPLSLTLPHPPLTRPSPVKKAGYFCGGGFAKCPLPFLMLPLVHPLFSLSILPLCCLSTVLYVASHPSLMLSLRRSLCCLSSVQYVASHPSLASTRIRLIRHLDDSPSMPLLRYIHPMVVSHPSSDSPFPLLCPLPLLPPPLAPSHCPLPLTTTHHFRHPYLSPPSSTHHPYHSPRPSPPIMHAHTHAHPT